MDNPRPIVSVIVPVYKAERFIERCCRSLFEQTLNEMEFIFVDDDSPDDSVQIIRNIADEFPNRQHQIKILSHSPNKGVSYARQQGMDVAKGDFVIHCDSDDWVEPDMYETMYSVAKAEGADVVCCGFIIEYPDGRKRVSSFDKKRVCSKVEFNLAPQTGSLCSKIVRLSMLRDAGVSFPQGINWGEDFCVSIAGLVLSRKTILLPDPFYHYRQNNESITHTITLRQCEELIKCGPFIESFLVRVKKNIEYGFQLDFLKFQLKSNLLKRKEVRDIKKWRDIFPESNKKVLRYDIPLYLKIASLLALFHLTPFSTLLLAMRDFYNERRI